MSAPERLGTLCGFVGRTRLARSTRARLLRRPTRRGWAAAPARGRALFRRGAPPSRRPRRSRCVAEGLEPLAERPRPGQQPQREAKAASPRLERRSLSYRTARPPVLDLPLLAARVVALGLVRPALQKRRHM